MKRLLLSKLRTGNNQFLALLQRTLLLAILLVGASSAWADNRLVLAESIKIGADDGGWAGTTIPASAFEKIQEGDVIEITRSDDTSHALTLSAGTWGDAFEIFRNYGWTATTENIIIQETILGDNTYTADQIIEKIKEKGIILNGSGPMYVKVSLILKGNNRIALSGNITYTGLTDKVAQIGDPVTYTYTLDSKFADAENVKYKWFITDRAAGDLVADNPYIYEYQVGTPGESNTFTFYPSAATSSGQNLMVCVHVSADGYNTDYAADWGNFTIAPMHKPTITQDGTNVNINVNTGHWISYKVNDGEAFPNYGNSVTLPNTNITALNNGDVITAHTWRPVDLTTSHYPESEDVSFTYTIASPDPLTTIKADLTARDHGSNVTIEDGVLTSTGYSDNWADIFVFPLSNHIKKNVSYSADNYTGIAVTSQGDAFRIIVYYNAENGDNKQTIVDATANKTTHYYTWEELGLTEASDIANIYRIAFAGPRQNEGATVNLSDTYLINEQKPVVIVTDSKERTVYKGKTINLSSTVNPGSFNVWDVYGDEALTQNLGFVGYMNSFTLDPQAGLTLNNGDVISFEDDNTYYFKAGAGRDLGDGHYGWADGEVIAVTVLPARTSYYVNFSAPAVFGASLPDGSITAQVQNGESWTDITSGSIVAPGATVKFTAKQFSENTAQGAIGANRLILKAWNLNGNEFKGTIPTSGIVWNNATSSYEMVVDDDVDFQAVYELSYKMHYADATSVNNSQNNATYDHGTVTASIGSDKINEWSGFRGNSVIEFTATPDDGYTLGHWEAYLKGAGDDPVWSSENMGGGSSLRLTVSGTTFDNAWGNDIYVKPVFKEVVYTQQTITVGDKTREYIVYIPESVKDNGQDDLVPVVFSLHGTGNDNYPDTYGVQNFNSVAEANKFIVVYPRGIDREFPAFGTTTRGWKSDGTRNEDVLFFEAVLDKLIQDGWNSSDYNINDRKVYISGFSNGGMMAYSTAFTSTRFAAFSSISGFQLNEFHLQHYGWNTNGGENEFAWQYVRPVPFMHIQGTKDDFVKYTLMPTIVDNMVYRNGCNPIPTVTTSENGADVFGTPMKYTKSVYTPSANIEGTSFPFHYYEIGSGISASDTGMGHNYGISIEGKSSEQLEWEFMSQFESHPNTGEGYNSRPRVEFYADLSKFYEKTHPWILDEEPLFPADKHGWTMATGTVLAKYGETTGAQTDLQNTYHTIQLGKGAHHLHFNSASDASNQTGLYVNVRLIKIGELSATNGNASAVAEKVVYDKNFHIGEIGINIDLKDDGVGEYQLIFTGNDENGNVSSAQGIKILNVGIYNNNMTDNTMETEYKANPNTDFTGYFAYHNRLLAQWNFDLCDGVRFNRTAIESSSLWTPDYTLASADHNYGTITYSYNQSITDSELTYGDAAKTVLPMASGLKFTANANAVKVQVTVSNGEVIKTQLVLDAGVQMTVPYIYNSFRNDKGSDISPYSLDTEAEQEQYADNKDCLHHINRDILYVSSSPWIFDAITNRCFDDTNLYLFNNGGQEKIDGKNFQKCNFTGNQGTPCVITFSRPITIDRLGVNRNLVYSFYTEYMNDFGYDKPLAGMRIIGTPRGSKVANLGGTYASYENAIAMTYGGWKFNDNRWYRRQRDDYRLSKGLQRGCCCSCRGSC